MAVMAVMAVMAIEMAIGDLRGVSEALDRLARLAPNVRRAVD